MIQFIFGFVVVSLSSIGVGCKMGQPVVNLNDSLSVEDFIGRTTVCNRVLFVEKNKRSFCYETGYSSLILSSIAKVTKEPIFIPFYNSGVRLSNEDQQAYLQDKMDEVKERLNCK